MKANNHQKTSMYETNQAVAGLNKVPGFNPLLCLRKTRSGSNGEEVLTLDLRYKKLWFRLAHPTGRLKITALRITEQLAIIEAKVFLDKNDTEPVASFTAQRTVHDTPDGLYLQAAQHEALDGALNDAGFGLQFADICAMPDEKTYGISIPDTSASVAIVPDSNGASAPAEAELPAQKLPIKESTKELPPQEHPIQESPVQEFPIQEPRAQELPVQALPIQETPAQELPIQGYPVQELPVQDTPAQELPTAAISSDSTINTPINFTDHINHKTAAATASASTGIIDTENTNITDSTTTNITATAATDIIGTEAATAAETTITTTAEAATATAAETATATDSTPPTNITQIERAWSSAIQNKDVPTTPQDALPIADIPRYTKATPLQELLTLMTYEEACQVCVDTGTCSGMTMKAVAEHRPPSLKWFTSGYSGDNNILRAAAQIMLEAMTAQKAG